MGVAKRKANDLHRGKVGNRKNDRVDITTFLNQNGWNGSEQYNQTMFDSDKVVEGAVEDIWVEVTKSIGLIQSGFRRVSDPAKWASDLNDALLAFIKEYTHLLVFASNAQRFT